MSGRRTTSDLNGNGVPDKLEKHHGLSDLNGNGIDDRSERRGTDLNRNGIPDQLERHTGVGAVNQVYLPTQVIEKPAAIHEEIRREQVEEIQPIINVEKLKTEVHQVIQPLVDREVKAVGVTQRTLASEVLPQVNMPNVGARTAVDVSSVTYKDSARVVEKPALYMETQKTQIIEEIQPVIYKETIVPTLIKETKPIYQTVVEGTTYTKETLGQQTYGSAQLDADGVPIAFGSRTANLGANVTATVVKKPAAIHEEVRREQVEEIQPVINVEKLKTEVHQVVQPLLDREVKPLGVTERTLAAEVLPQINQPTVALRTAEDMSTVTYKDSSRVVEKPALYMETQKTQIIEEIQPVIYKETIVPTLIKETKPIYQTVVEGTVYTQETLGQANYGSAQLDADGVPISFGSRTANLGANVTATVVKKPTAIHEEVRREQVEEIQPVINIEKLKTEVHQVVQPLVDREVKAVGITERTLASEILPQVNMPNVALRAADDISTISYHDSARVVEKPALYMETQKTQIIEEIQPVIYKETIVPTLIKETKPIYQTIVEGTTYTHAVLPPAQLKGSAWSTKVVYTSATDLNGNGIPDALEGRSGLTSGINTMDLNRNGIPDVLERRSGDSNHNGIPDVLERRSGDSNHNGIPDVLEKRSGDLNRNGIPDKLEQTTTTKTTTNSPYTPL